jgi:hypothetical protein
MSRWFTPARRHTRELMDSPGLPAAEVAEAYFVLSKINRHLGNARTVHREWCRFCADDLPDDHPISILDVGSGMADLTKRIQQSARAQAIKLRAFAIDRDQTATVLASREVPNVVRADALRLPFPDQSIDIVLAVKLAHHFEGSWLARLLDELTRVARRRVIVLDIRRHWLAYWGFVAWSSVCTRNRLVRHDGPVSVLRGFTPAELQALARGQRRFDWTVRSYAPFQLVLVGRNT